MINRFFGGIVRKFFFPIRTLLYWYRLMKDRMLGTDYLGMVSADELGYTAGDGKSCYEATHIRFLSKIDKIVANVSEADCMLDVGCGKGIMLKYFSGFAFGRVDGIEYSPVISGIAKENMIKEKLKCKVFTGDAAVFDRLGDYNYFYLYNPFSGKVLQGFIQNLIRSQELIKRKVIVIYSNPVGLDFFLKADFKIVDVDESLKDKFLDCFLPGVIVLER